MFMESIANTLNTRVTENGAIGYRTTGKALLDMNFAVASLRHSAESKIIEYFNNAFSEDPMFALKWLFYARDVREGLGERRLFRTIVQNLANTNPECIIPLIKLIPEYGRYDDLWCLLDNTAIAPYVYEFVAEQLANDIENMKSNKPISLLAKWMPSVNASSAETLRRAKMLCKAFHVKESTYRHTLSALRKYLDVVEVKMSDNKWANIDYAAVPSCANLKYKNAFMRHDTDRRAEYLASVAKGDTKINAGTLFPHEIVHRYSNSNNWWFSISVKDYDETLEALWKALPNMVKDCDNTLVVADGSGSMGCIVDSKSSVRAIHVANALAIYFAERAGGEFKNKYITFSEQPQLVNLGNNTTLRDKLNIAYKHTECANTNIEAVFELILNTAIDNNMPQSELPKNILIISDMEFDAMAVTNQYDRYNYCGYARPDQRLFTDMTKRYSAAGYKLPRLVFWNVNSRTNAIPVTENELGVALVSGFSVNICNMIMQNETDPYKCLVSVLNSPRYAAIEEAFDTGTPRTRTRTRSF